MPKSGSAHGSKSPRRAAKGVVPHLDLAVGTELSRNALSRERYVFLVAVTSGIAAALILSICVNLYLALRPVEIRYFVTDSAGGVREIATLDRPIQSENFVLNWTTGVVTKAYSMNFANYSQQLKDIQSSFNEAGWNGYQEALASSEFIQKMLSNQYATSAVPKSAPVIVNQGLLDGVWAWRVEVPIIVSYKSASNSLTQEITVKAVVVRRPETENPSGLAIAQIISQ